MGEAYFYHLTRRPLEASLPVLLDKALSAGWRVAVRGVTPERLDWLDRQLWITSEDSFLPHGIAGGPHDASQPVLLTLGEAGNDPGCLMSIDGAEVSATEVGATQRVCILFDGHDDTALAQARRQWKTLTQQGCKAQYWSEASGRWEMAAQA